MKLLDQSELEAVLAHELAHLALASALLKLDRENDLLPRADLREVEARAVLCILGKGTSRLGPLFCTHPSTAKRVKRLQAIEERLQARGRAVQLED